MPMYKVIIYNMNYEIKQFKYKKKCKWPKC